MATKNQLTEQGKQSANLVINNSFIDGIAKVLEEKKEFGLTFPNDYNPTNALTGAYLVLKETQTRDKKPVLEACSQTSIANALMDMVTLGLSVQKKQAYFVPYGNSLNLMISTHGNKAIAHRCGAKHINAEVIYDGDVFKYHIENGRKVIDEHTQDFMNIDNTKIKGAYCVIELTDGAKYVEVMNYSQIEAAWKKGYGYKPCSGVHAEFTDMMAKKTVTNRATKNFAQQFGDSYVVGSMDTVSNTETLDRVEENVTYDVVEKANKDTFVEAQVDDDEVEKVEGEIVDDKAPF